MPGEPKPQSALLLTERKLPFTGQGAGLYSVAAAGPRRPHPWPVSSWSVAPRLKGTGNAKPSLPPRPEPSGAGEQIPQFEQGLLQNPWRFELSERPTESQPQG